jgi:hypothetical protein
MAHFALVDENGIVQNVLFGNNDEPDEGYQWLIDNLGGNWVKTSWNTKGGVHYNPETNEPSEDQTKALRKNYAVIGGTYDSVRDAFIPPKPYPSWVLDEQKCVWKAPVENPFLVPFQVHYWSEEEQMWKSGEKP